MHSFIKLLKDQYICRSAFSMHSKCVRHAFNKPKSNEKTESVQQHRYDATNYSWRGLPDMHSNIRPIKFHVAPNELPNQTAYRKAICETQAWHHRYWESHNTKFYKEKSEFIMSRQLKGETVTPDEMSVFYKKFLDENYQLHSRYNKEWYKKNCYLLWLALKAYIEKMFIRTNKTNR